MSEIVVAAFRSLWARPLRSVLMATGAAIGVAIVVGSQGIVHSAKEDINSTLRELGTNLVVVEAQAGLSSPGLAPEAGERASALTSVESVAAASLVTGAAAVSPRYADAPGDDVSTAVWAVSDDLLDVVSGAVRAGRPLTTVDDSAELPGVVLGAELAATLLVDHPYDRTVLIGDEVFAIVGTLEPVALAPEFDTAILIPRSVAARRFGFDDQISRLYVRVDEAQLGETSRLLPLAVTYGDGPPPTVRVASRLLEAQGAVDAGLSRLYLALGGVAALIGAFGIFNTMQLSMIERTPEIGLRRAIGHQRRAIAMQFVTESFVVGLFGAACGAVIGALTTFVVAHQQGWRFAGNLWLTAVAVIAGVALSVAAGTLVAARAARLEPAIALQA